jgi:glycosyltransferase involved in cell wall biosynthesis
VSTKCWEVQLWIEKEALPWWPQWFESALLRRVPYVLDIDDAVFHNYDQHRLGVVRRLFGRRIDGLMARAALVVGGNDYLARHAKEAGAPWVEVLPTVIDLARYPGAPCSIHAADSLPRIVWIGSPSTVRYLELIRESLQALALRVPFVLRVMGANVEWPDMNVECVRWSEATEVTFIAEGSIGVMPLPDSPWERGKCGYKLIQYMACGVPVVASPVGVNPEIVQDGCHGFLAATKKEWAVALERLLTDPKLCNDMGREGRKRVESNYCLQVTGPRMVTLLKQAAQGT